MCGLPRKAVAGVAGVCMCLGALTAPVGPGAGNHPHASGGASATVTTAGLFHDDPPSSYAPPSASAGIMGGTAVTGVWRGPRSAA